MALSIYEKFFTVNAFKNKKMRMMTVKKLNLEARNESKMAKIDFNLVKVK